jgi:uncharacterized membrane protein YqjE
MMVKFGVGMFGLSVLIVWSGLEQKRLSLNKFICVIVCLNITWFAVNLRALI